MPDNQAQRMQRAWPILALLIGQMGLFGCGDDISIPQASPTATQPGGNETLTPTATQTAAPTPTGQATASPSGGEATSPIGVTPTPGPTPSAGTTPMGTSTPTGQTPAPTATPGQFTPTAGEVTSTPMAGTDPVITPVPTVAPTDAPTPQGTPTARIDADGDGFTGDVDCDDGDNTVYPGAPEVCDDQDNSCNGLTDDDDGNLDLNSAETFYWDGDGDGYGDMATTIQACQAPTGYVADGEDCNDADVNYYPGAPESCTDPVDLNCDGAVGFTDSDGDGVPACEDCDDNNASVYPSATEVCDPDNTDENCNGFADNSDTGTAPESKTRYYPDGDLDGYGDENHPGALFCDAPNGYVAVQGDCNDQLDGVNPDATEVCNGNDDDCDGKTDDADDSVDLTGATTWYEDADADSYGDAGSGTAACSRPAGTVANADDCDDTQNSVYPNAPEACDGTDNDCDGSADEGAPTSTFYADGDGDGYGLANDTIQACGTPEGYSAQAGDCNDEAAGVNPGATEVCDPNNVDENCNNTADNSDLTTDPATKTQFWPDGDGDGYATDSHPGGQFCDAPTNYADTQGDCDDTNAAINPGANEACNNIDDDCDGLVDQNDDSLDPSTQTTWYEDNDGDNYGDDGAATSSCDRPSGYVATGGDCNDNDGSINPEASEICNGVNDDCDLSTDEGVEPATWYLDQDGDDYGVGSDTTVACEAPVGYAAQGADCNDGNANINPGEDEICNDIDDDCSGQADDGLTFITYYADGDGDSFGDGDTAQSACSEPDGYVTNANDCDDGDSSIYPNATERCNFIDDDCDSTVDEDSQPTTWYADADGDGFGNAEATQTQCEEPAGFVANDDDCNDNNGSINPDADEVCDGSDNNCNGQSDEDSAVDASTWYADQDDDGHGNEAGGTTTACNQPDGFAAGNDDCNDNDGAINPSAEEDCDFIDNDCDEIADEGIDGTQTFYTDGDEDGFGDAAAPVESCVLCPGCADNSTDCDDTRADVYPGAPERLDGVDNDCNGAIEGDLSASSAHGGFTGVSSGGRVGFAVDFIGDFDGDGFDDIAVGAPRMNSRSGAVYVIYGKADGWDHGLISQVGALINGTALEAEYGFSLTGGDLNGDGKGDLSVGAPQADTNNGISRDGGSISITYGSDERIPDVVTFEELEDTFSDGYFDEVQLGYSMDAHGDMNNDGIDDLLIGAPWYYVTMDPPAGGYTFVLPGQLSEYGGIFGIEGNQFYHFKGEGSQTIGMNTIHVGDVDNNGIGDWLAIGYGDVSTGVFSSDEDCGMNYFVRGTDADNLGIGSDGDMYIQDFSSAKYYGNADNELVGESAARLGDFNNDNRPDFALGRGGSAGSEALAFVFLGGDSVPGEGVVDEKATLSFTSSSGLTCPCTVGGLGDINSDGIEDMAVGVTEASGGGRVFIFYGENRDRNAGPFTLTLESDADHMITGENGGDAFGSDIAGMGDVNGDGKDDFIIGAWGYDSNAGSEVGKTYLFLGY